jgi:hypothetical protein
MGELLENVSVDSLLEVRIWFIKERYLLCCMN